MKVVINSSYGGFSLSHEAIMAYAKRKGTVVYPELSSRSRAATLYWTVPPEQQTESGNGQTLYDREIPRDDSDLIAVIEELGEAADGRHARLTVVEIPDDVQWQIEEYDGYEHVAEKHRTWS